MSGADREEVERLSRIYGTTWKAEVLEEEARKALAHELRKADLPDEILLESIRVAGIHELSVKVLSERVLTMTRAPSWSLVIVPASRPPSSLMLDLFMKPSEAREAFLNLEEVYAGWVDRHGPRRARAIWRFQIARLVVGHWWGRAIGETERLAKLFRTFGLGR